MYAFMPVIERFVMTPAQLEVRALLASNNPLAEIEYQQKNVDKAQRTAFAEQLARGSH